MSTDRLPRGRRSPVGVIVDWYDQKTDFLLEKYGPGPRVHYHTGWAPADITPAPTRSGLREQLVHSQEQMLWQAAHAWDARNRLCGDVLDVGCGLGGTALFFAAEFGATVTALSPVPRHLALVSEFARQAGVADRVSTSLGDAHEIDGPARYDAVVSFGATTYFDRAVYFDRLARAVRPGGCVFIEDTFLGRDELAAPFHDYWTSNIGWQDEYERAARTAGFETLEARDVSAQAAGFWRLSVEYTRHLTREKSRPAQRSSIEWQSAIYDAYLDGGLRNLFLSFRRR